MLELKILSLVICVHILIGSTHGADKYTDENRPYEFGFTIDGEQHRHEKKDENGIIMGEFGFITADGVYHVTVYATDENGNFKILSMKNIRVKPYPTAGAKKGHSLPFPPSENAPVIQGPSETSKSEKESKAKQTNQQIASSAKSCSHCSLPTTTTKAPMLTDIAVVSRDRPVPETPRLTSSQEIPQTQKNQIYQHINTEVSNSHLQTNKVAGQKETNIVKPVAVSALGPKDIPQIQSTGQIHNSYIQEDKFEDQQIYEQQNLGQNYKQQDFSGHPNIQESNINKPNFQPENTIKLHNPHQDGILNSNNQQANVPQLASDKMQEININKPNFQPENTIKLNNPQQGIFIPNNEQANVPEFASGNIQISQDLNNPNVHYPQEKSNVNQNQQRVENYNAHEGPAVSPPQSVQQLAEKYKSADKTTPEELQTFQGTLRNPKQYSPISASNTGVEQPQGFEAALASQANKPTSNKPMLIAAQMQIVPKDTDIHHKRPGEVEGLPAGLSKDDMTQLLYTFNYTVGFHGHHEKGYTNGAKEGYYYIAGRNGIRTRVDYIADANGFRPKISQEVLDLLSDDVPKVETEKDEKFGLKGYEFKWLYYPADDKIKQ